MSKKLIKVNELEIPIYEKNGEDFFNLTELAKKFGSGNPQEKIRNWMRNKDTLNFLETYESLYNPDFNTGHMTGIKENNSRNNTRVSAGDYIAATNAKFMKVEKGRYGGVFANFDISAHFMMWLSSAWQIFFIKDYHRMKMKELEEKDSLLSDIFYAQKNVDNLMESLRYEQDRLALLKRKQAKKLKK